MVDSDYLLYVMGYLFKCWLKKNNWYKWVYIQGFFLQWLEYIE